VCLVGGLLTAFFLFLYVARKYPMPIGYDTPRYLFQTNFVAERGLANVPTHLPPPIRSLDTRTGFPVSVLTLASLFRTTTFTTAALVPPVAAAAIALAAGALVSWSLRRNAWEFAAIALVVGTSTVMVRLMVPETYTDNLIAVAAFTAALIPLLSAARDGPGLWTAVVLFGIGGLVHPPFYLLMVGVLALVAVVFAPRSWRMWRADGRGILSTPSGRLGLALAGSAAFTTVGFAAVIRAVPVSPKQTRYELAKKIRQDIPIYLFPVTGPLAAIGAAVLAANARLLGRRAGHPQGDGQPDDRLGVRLVLALLLAWIVVALLGVLAYYLGRNTPAHRFLAFLIPVPVLIAVALLAAGRWVSTRTMSAAGAAIVIAGVAALAFLGGRQYYVTMPDRRGVEWMDPGKVHDAAAAVAYLDRERVPSTAPVVYVIDDRGPNPLSSVPEMTYILRAVLSPDRIEHAFFYVGDPANYLAGRPTYRPAPASYNANENRFWPTIRSLIPQRPVALLLSSYNPAYGTFATANQALVAGPNLVVLEGPIPPAPVTPGTVPRGPKGLVFGAGLGLGTIVVVTLIGLGWAMALLPSGVRPFEALAVSPAIGLAFLVFGGIIVDAVGIRLTGFGGASTVLLVGLSGLAAALGRRRGGTRARVPQP
jgi:hypothetical protein